VLSSGQGSGGLTNRTVDAIGGVETVTLTEAQMPQHSHGVGATTSGTDGDHAHTITDPGHFHTFPGGNNQNYAQGNPLSMSSNHTNTPNTTTVTTGISINNHPYPYPTHSQGTQHKHIITVSETAKGSSNAHENMPPFYVLAFIMRIS
jgi:microcystin-dependent protein